MSIKHHFDRLRSRHYERLFTHESHSYSKPLFPKRLPRITHATSNGKPACASMLIILLCPADLYLLRHSDTSFHTKKQALEFHQAHKGSPHCLRSLTRLLHTRRLHPQGKACRIHPTLHVIPGLCRPFHHTSTFDGNKTKRVSCLT